MFSKEALGNNVELELPRIGAGSSGVEKWSGISIGRTLEMAFSLTV